MGSFLIGNRIASFNNINMSKFYEGILIIEEVAEIKDASYYAPDDAKEDTEDSKA